MTQPRWYCLLVLLMLALGSAELPLLPADEPKTDKDFPAVAHIRLSGGLDETPVSEDPLLGSGSENFRSKIERLKKAAADKKVAGIYLHLDGVETGWAKVDELIQTIELCRSKGKKIFGYLEGGGTRDFLIALACDEVCMPASSYLMLTGMYSEVTFYADLLAKLGIRAEMLWMGVYKFTGEAYVRTSMSPEARKQMTLVLDDFFEHSLVGAIARNRQRAGQKNLTPEAVKKIIDQGPFTARKAHESGLIDRVSYAGEFEDSFKKALGTDRIKLVRNYAQAKGQQLDLSNPFDLFKLLSPPKTQKKSGKDRIALLYATGTIVTGRGGVGLLDGRSIGSTTMVEAIRQAENDPSVKAIVLRVDSPGGSALASDLIWQELKRCKKPVIASMSDVAASGGYYICMGARKIFAQPGTLTGSIGVVGGKLALRGLYDKIGITTDVIQHGTNSGILSTTDGFTPSQRKAMEALMQETYEQFLAKAMEGRAAAGKKFTREQFLKVAEGRIWTGRQAKENGLVDELGSLEDAIGEARRQAGLAQDADIDYLILPKPRSLLDTLLEAKGETSLLARQLGPLTEVPGLTRHLQAVEALLQLRQEPVWLLAPHSLEIR